MQRGDEEETESDYVGAEQISGDWETDPLNVLILCREEDEEETESDYMGAEPISRNRETVPLNVLNLCREEEEG